MDFEKFMTNKYKKEKGCMETSERKNELEKYLSDEC